MHVMLLSICDFRENQHREDRTFLLTWWHRPVCTCAPRQRETGWVVCHRLRHLQTFIRIYFIVEHLVLTFKNAVTDRRFRENQLTSTFPNLLISTYQLMGWLQVWCCYWLNHAVLHRGSCKWCAPLFQCERSGSRYRLCFRVISYTIPRTISGQK